MSNAKIIGALTAFFFGMVELFLVFRFVLKIFGANFGAAFTDMIYGATDTFVSPFEGVFPTLDLGFFVLETSTILAIIVYGVIAFILTNLLINADKFFGKKK